ncbi:MAG: hypothetical protein KDC54_01150 [Lewinella sp.]|nr:hypothetical protein [Lewinella sp.]
MRVDIQINNPDGREIHGCESRQEEGWIIYSCPECPDYERRFHLATGKMTVTGIVPEGPLHLGNYTPPALDEELIHPN